MARPVYLLDFSVYKPPEELRLDIDEAKRRARDSWTVRGRGDRKSDRRTALGMQSGACVQAACGKQQTRASSRALVSCGVACGASGRQDLAATPLRD